MVINCLVEGRTLALTWNKYGYTTDTQLFADVIVGPRPTSTYM